MSNMDQLFTAVEQLESSSKEALSKAVQSIERLDKKRQTVAAVTGQQSASGREAFQAMTTALQSLKHAAASMQTLSNACERCLRVLKQ